MRSVPLLLDIFFVFGFACLALAEFRSCTAGSLLDDTSYASPGALIWNLAKKGDTAELAQALKRTDPADHSFEQECGVRQASPKSSLGLVCLLHIV
jgi:hypothetical protein